MGGHLLGGVQWGVSKRLNLLLSGGLNSEGPIYSVAVATPLLTMDGFELDGLGGLAGTVSSGERSDCAWPCKEAVHYGTLRYLSFAPHLGLRAHWPVLPRLSFHSLVRVSESMTVITQNYNNAENTRATWLEAALGVSVRIAGPVRLGLSANGYKMVEFVQTHYVSGTLSASYTFGEKPDE